MENKISELIKRKCFEAGFIKVGFAKAEELKRESAFLKDWLDEKRNADMNWMANNFERRTDPSNIMEDVISVISLAYLYDTPVAHSENRNIPKISRYAWGERDYHKIIKKKLKILCKEIEALSDNIQTRVYVDDGPMMDKAWAVRSGIGWMGKNTNVINSETGSFFFLAEILINIELEFDKPAEDLCKSCRLCIDACPTGAIYDEYKLDANLCISYQTIENRNEIPSEIDLNGWIFGCDICQDVCPFNDNKFFTNDINFYPKKEILNKNIDELMKMNEAEFNITFEGTPVRRTKFSGWKRNLIKFKSKS
ncbi:MAG TPA: tRNA epoxyqueuosine(34) reductase QueG [Ignavibacteria bacterium]|nr:tRNA epoxyqueuosine(34) reductase QueG [Ignavibacteria bacterium]